jgi:pimeloyl-ACP methyl ester carboxylesterase
MTALLGSAPLLALILLLLALGLFAALRYGGWIDRCTRQLEAGSTIVQTSQGWVEYALLGAGGPVILFAHSQPGGYDQGALFADATLQHGFRLLSVSRPGYLRTPLDVGPTPAEQADTFAALLDARSIHRVAVVSLSGGGPAALEFALRHPARCIALVAISAVSLSHSPPATITSWLLSTRFFTSNVAGWLMDAVVRRRPALLARVLVADPTSRAEILLDPRKRSALMTLAQAGMWLPAQRRAGSRNDVEQVASLRRFPVEALQVPTLVIHGTADELVPYPHALFIAERAPGAELCAIHGGTHTILVTHADQVVSRLFAFLDTHVTHRVV